MKSRWIMGLSRKSIELLLDLTDIRIDTFLVQDQDDIRELAKLRKCKKELEQILQLLQNKDEINESYLHQQAIK